ncbi:MAG: TetR/AcrR family transcriptional regulator [Flavobacteriales bacterium]
MNFIELSNQKEIALIKRVNDVYINKGVKRTTMDDMAKSLNVSKKTLYKYVKNRKELVMKSTYFHVSRDRKRVTEIQNENYNPIVEQYELAKFVIETISKINPVLHFDLENYFPEAWHYLNQYFNGFVFESLYRNLIRGQSEGMYHSNFKPEIVARFFATRIDVIFDGELFPSSEFNFKDIYLEYLMYHLNSIVSEQGKETLNTLDFKHL